MSGMAKVKISPTGLPFVMSFTLSKSVSPSLLQILRIFSLFSVRQDTIKSVQNPQISDFAAFPVRRRHQGNPFSEVLKGRRSLWKKAVRSGAAKSIFPYT
jgi:hypothetical protein